MRNSGVGFWNFPYPGRLTYGDRMMAALLDAQQEGHVFDPEGRLDLDAGEIKKFFPEYEFVGHAAWLQFPWKLHRIVEGDQEKLELYHLIQDPRETSDLTSISRDQVEIMLASLNSWQHGVMKSLNGKDY